MKRALNRIPQVKRKYVRGFTLLEVVVALAVLAITLTTVYESFGWALRRSSALQSKESALLHAQSLLEAKLAQTSLTTGVQSGTMRDGYKWEVDIHAYRDRQIGRGGHLTPFEARVTVRWGSRLQQAIQLKGLALARPAT